MFRVLFFLAETFLGVAYTLPVFSNGQSVQWPDNILNTSASSFFSDAIVVGYNGHKKYVPRKVKKIAIGQFSIESISMRKLFFTALPPNRQQSANKGFSIASRTWVLVSAVAYGNRFDFKDRVRNGRFPTFSTLNLILKSLPNIS